MEFAKDSGTLYKAHVMRVLWQYGLSDGMYNTVYRSLFGLRPVRGKILHTPVYETVDTILNLIQECRGVAVLAHPSVYHSMPLARELIAAGRLDGVEIDHPRNTEEDKAELNTNSWPRSTGLIVTGGTDYHGMNTNTPHPVGTPRCTTADEKSRQYRTIALAERHPCSIMSGSGIEAKASRCPCFGSLFPPLAALTFAASSIICAFGLASAAPRSPYRHLELCGIASQRGHRAQRCRPPYTAGIGEC